MKTFLHNLACRCSESGAGVVEFALVAPVVFLLMFASIDFSLILIGNTVGGNAAREGARVGIINYECADVPAGCTDHTGAAVNNYTLIDTAVKRLLGDLVRGTPTTAVRCLDVDELSDADNGEKACQFNTIDLDRDLIEVKVVWQHIGASPFVANASHTETTRMIISGKPDLTPAPSTSAAPTTTTAVGATTTTSSPASTTTTAAPQPTLSTLQMFDTQATPNGKVDQVVATFSLALPAACNTMSMWSLSNTPSGGSLASVAIAGSTATLSITEGAGAQDTAVGGFTVSFNPSGSCVANNFTNTPPADKAKPVPVAVTFANVGANVGKMDVGDTVTVQFSESIGGLPSSPTSVVFDDTGDNEKLSITGLTNGQMAVTTVAATPGYVKKNQTVTNPGSVALVGTDSIRVTLTAGSCGNCQWPGGSTTTAYTFVPAATIIDLASPANAAAGSLAGSQTIF